MEAIAFQNGTFFKELTHAIEVLIDGRGSRESIKESKFNEIVFAHTGILTALVVERSLYADASVSVPILDHNHPLINQWRREFFTDNKGIRGIREARSALKGEIDLRAGKVSGIFSTLEARVYISTTLLASADYLTAAEMAAFMIHELGHVFTHFEFLAESVTTNQFLSSISSAVLTETDHSKRVVLIGRAEKELGITVPSKEELANATDGKIIQTVLITTKIQQARSALGSSVYDSTSWEYLADQFTARHGAGRELVTGLDKLNRYTGNPSYKTAVERALITVYRTIGLIFLTGVTATYVGPLAVMLPILSIWATTFSDSAPTYDDIEFRFKRVRGQLVENLKDRTIDPLHREKLLDDIRTLDTILVDIKDRRDFLDVIWDNLLPGRRKARNQLVLQHDLEKLAANSLFVHSADLKKLSESV